MLTIQRREMVLAVTLAAVAGFVDAIGFVHLSGSFLSFMSGNTTRMAAATTLGHWNAVEMAAAIIGMFMLGVVAGAIVSRVLRTRVWVLTATTVTLAAAAAIGHFVPDTSGLLVAAAAMGVMNAVFQRSGEVSVGVTYMTGTLVKAGHRLVDAFCGGPRWAWLRYLGLWGGLACGAVTGAFAYRAISLDALWIAVAGLVVCTVTVFLVARRPKIRQIG